MKIVRPSAELLKITPNAEQIIERCGRICYKSEDKITEDSASRFIQMIIEKGHLSVIEHASATILFVCDRGVSHELVRHRLVSYSQESTRYCCYAKEKFGSEITVIEPPDLGVHRKEWENSCTYIESNYMQMIRGGVKPEIARSILPNCLKTEIVTTTNLREWGHILSLRTSKAAHPQIREIMHQAAKILKDKCPNIFCDFDKV